MIAEIGQFALLLALSLALVQAISPLVGIQNNNAKLVALAKPAAFGQFLLLLISFGLLAVTFVQHDFSVIYVASNSNLALPLLYRIAAVWGGHEGSLLLWSLMIAGWGAALAIGCKKAPSLLHARALAVMGLISVGFLLFMILTSNPFARVFPAPLDGNDLNPLLQDPGLVFHPPLLYMGYVGFAIAFSFSVAAMIEGRSDARWMRLVRPWTCMAWAFLTCGISLGSWWAYNELGWGGWWFWDPVENASFMPWLAGTALIHALAVSDKRGLFKSWSILLAVLAFSLSLLGTFLVRSGVLSSVHSFASDPTRGLFILLLLALVVGGSLILYAKNAHKLAADGEFTVTSRETCLLLNSIFMVSGVVTVLLGTVYPLGLEAITGDKISVGPPYFNTVMLLLTAPAFIVIGFAMHTKWRQDNFLRVLRFTAAPLSACIVASVLLPWLIFGTLNWQASIGSFVAAWIFVTTLQTLYGDVARSKLSIFATFNKTRGRLGMATAHIGIAVFILGVTYISVFGQQRDVRLVENEVSELGDYSFSFNGIDTYKGPNYDATRANINVVTAKGNTFDLAPEKRVYSSSPNPLTESAINISVTRDIYVSLGNQRNDGSWSARLQVKPFIRWIWFGTILMALGGLLAAIDLRYKRS